MILFLTPFFAEGQIVRSLNTCAGFQNTALKSDRVSPLIFSGVVPYFGLSWRKQSDKKSNSVSAAFSKGRIANRYGTKSNYWLAEINTLAFFHKEKERTDNLLLGWSNSNIMVFSQHQGFQNYSELSHYVTNFGLAADYTSGFKIKEQRFVFECPVNLQLIGFSLSPSYISNSPEGFLDPENGFFEAFFKSVDLFFPGKGWNIAINPSLSYPLKSGNEISLAYRYEYLQINGAHKFRHSRGAWFLSLKTRI